VLIAAVVAAARTANEQPVHRLFAAALGDLDDQHQREAMAALRTGQKPHGATTGAGAIELGARSVTVHCAFDTLTGVVADIKLINPGL
jgi:hypothetical protein